MTTEPWYERTAVTVVRFLRAGLSAILGAAITILTFVAAFPARGDIPILMTGIIFLLLLLMVVISVRDIQKRGNMRKFSDDLDASLNALTQGLSGALENLLIELELTETNVRATIYCHNSDQRTFIPLARYSQNPVLSERGRLSYPEDQGVIALAWQNRAVIEHFSDVLETRLKQFEKQKLTRHVISNLNMQAKSIIGVRLDAPNGNQANPHIGLVVIEHETRKALTAQHMERIKSSLVFDTLRHLIHPARTQLMELSRVNS